MGVVRAMDSEDNAFEVVREILYRKYGMKVSKHQRLASFVDQNYHVTATTSTNTSNEYIAKVLNEDDVKLKNVDAIEKVMLCVRDAGMCAPKPIQTLDGRLNYSMTVTTETGETNPLFVLLEYIPGTMLSDIDVNDNILLDLGRFAGKLDRALQKYDGEDVRNTCYLRQGSELLSYMDATETSKCTVAREIIELLQTKVLDHQDKLQAGLVHYDLSPMNLIVKTHSSDNCTISAVIDFGDVCFSYYIFEIAITIAHAIMHWKSFDIMRMRDLISKGYAEEIMLNDYENDILNICIVARMLMSSVYSESEFRSDPSNSYVLQFIDWEKIYDMMTIIKST